MVFCDNLTTTNVVSSLKVGNYEIFYDNQNLAETTYQEIFIEQIYQFNCTEEEPFIIDAGSNVGFATLFFKMKYPKAKLLCFEPDPHAFRLLKKNVETNALSKVHLVNAALAHENGSIIFYGEIGTPGSDSRGNSIMKSWGMQRQSSIQTIVQSTRLSQYIDRPVDFLKLDIEGAEQIVLEELGDKLKFIKNLSMEVHETATEQDSNKVQKIIANLEKYGFLWKHVPLSIENYLPTEISEWVSQNHPQLSLIHATKCLK